MYHWEYLQSSRSSNQIPKGSSVNSIRCHKFAKRKCFYLAHFYHQKLNLKALHLSDLVLERGSFRSHQSDTCIRNLHQIVHSGEITRLGHLMQGVKQHF